MENEDELILQFSKELNDYRALDQKLNAYWEIIRPIDLEENNSPNSQSREYINPRAVMQHALHLLHGKIDHGLRAQTLYPLVSETNAYKERSEFEKKAIGEGLERVAIEIAIAQVEVLLISQRYQNQALSA